MKENDDFFDFGKVNKEMAVNAVSELRINHSAVASIVKVLKEHKSNNETEHMEKIVKDLYERMSWNIGTLENYLREIAD